MCTIKKFQSSIINLQFSIFNLQSIKESRLLVGYSQFAVDSGQYALHLSEGEHSPEQRISCIVSVAALVHDAAGLVGEGHAMVHAHGQPARRAQLLILEDAAQLNEVGASAQVAGLGEVAIGEDVA